MSPQATLEIKQRKSILFAKKLSNFIKKGPSLIKEHKGSFIVIFSWLIIAEISGYSLGTLLIAIGKLIIYPLFLLLFNTEFESLNVPEIFILLLPLVTLITVGFLIIIATED